MSIAFISLSMVRGNGLFPLPHFNAYMGTKMLFHKSDRENVHNILAASEGNRVLLHSLTSEIKDLGIISRRIENLQENILNDIEILKSRIIALENRIIPKLAAAPSISSKSTAKKK